MSDRDMSSFGQIDALLEEERRILMSGNVEKLIDLIPRKEALIDALNRAENDERAALTRLDDKIRRNQLLLDSAMEGIRSVSRRLATLRRVRSSLDTYDSHGQKQSIKVDAAGKIEKRA